MSHSRLPFARGSTMADQAITGLTLDANSYMGVAGQTYEVQDTVNGTGQTVLLRCLKNGSSDLTVARKFIEFSVTSAKDWGRVAAGYADTAGAVVVALDDAYTVGQVIKACQPCRYEIGRRERPLRPDHPQLAGAGRRVALFEASREVADANGGFEWAFGDDCTPGFEGFEQVSEQHRQLAPAYAQQLDRIEIDFLDLQCLDHPGDTSGNARRRALHQLRKLPQPGRNRLPPPSG